MTTNEIAVIRHLIAMFEESHADEIQSGHHGDGTIYERCSYCDAMDEAEKLCAAAEGKLKNPDLIKVEAPARWASYLINGDSSGLDEGEEDEADDEFFGLEVIDVGEESFFGQFNGLGDTLAVYTCLPCPNSDDPAADALATSEALNNPNGTLEGYGQPCDDRR